jgi:hypothetical protein
MHVTLAFQEASARACIRALRGLEQTAIMLERWEPECVPADEQDRVHIARSMTEQAAEAIRAACMTAVREVENFPDDEPGLIAAHGRLRSAMLEIDSHLEKALARDPSADGTIMGHVREADGVARSALTRYRARLLAQTG